MCRVQQLACVASGAGPSSRAPWRLAPPLPYRPRLLQGPVRAAVHGLPDATDPHRLAVAGLVNKEHDGSRAGRALLPVNGKACGRGRRRRGQPGCMSGWRRARAAGGGRQPPPAQIPQVERMGQAKLPGPWPPAAPVGYCHGRSPASAGGSATLPRSSVQAEPPRGMRQMPVRAWLAAWRGVSGAYTPVTRQYTSPAGEGQRSRGRGVFTHCQQPAAAADHARFTHCRQPDPGHPLCRWKEGQPCASVHGGLAGWCHRCVPTRH